METTSKIIILKTTEPRGFEVYYEYRKIGGSNKSSFMIRLTIGWGDIAEHLKWLLISRCGARRLSFKIYVKWLLISMGT